MYKYTKMVKNGKVNFLDKYKYNKDYDSKSYNNKEINNWNTLLKNFTINNRSEICGVIDFASDINNDKLSLVKLLLVEYDYFCFLYKEGKIDNGLLAQSVGSRLNYLLYLYNIIGFEGLDYLEDGDRDRINLAYNYLFSNLYVITILNHDKDNKYRRLILSNSNNYEDICINCNLNMDNINYEEEFNTFVNDYNMDKVLELRKMYKKKKKKC